MTRFYIATEDDILEGKTTDIYFQRTREILEKSGLANIRVRMEAHVYSLPRNYKWAVFAGLEEVVHLMKGKNIDLYSLPEGTIFKEKEPLMLIEGKYADIAIYETPILGILRHYSSIATKAARIKKIAGGKSVLFFGLRALHPAIMPMADRAAYIGGVDAVSGVLSKSFLGLEPKGTMPHALIIVFEDPVKAWKAFDEIMSDKVPRIALVDTFYDERYEALLAAKTLGNKLHGVRLDTPSSRRGDMRKIIEEVKWVLELHGFKDVKIYVSGGIDEEEIKTLRDIADAFGVGTSIAFPPSIDISMDIVEIKKRDSWIPISKRGKLPGAKQLYRCWDYDLEDYIIPFSNSRKIKCRNGEEAKPLLKKYIENGHVVEEMPEVRDIRNYVLRQLKLVDL